MNKDITLEDLGYERDYEIYTDTLAYFYKARKPHKYIIFHDKNNIESDYCLSVKELQAIYNKCKEIGWLDE